MVKKVNSNKIWQKIVDWPFVGHEVRPHNNIENLGGTLKGTSKGNEKGIEKGTLRHQYPALPMIFIKSLYRTLDHE